MEVTRDALLRIVKAARLADRMEADLRKVLFIGGGSNGRTWMDEIVGDLFDALYQMCRETLKPEQDFLDHSMVVRLLRSAKDDGQVTDQLMLMAYLNGNGSKLGRHELRQPEPRTMEPEEMRDMVEKIGGYMFGMSGMETPEGEWR